MALIKTDWQPELQQIKAAAKELVDDDLNPMIKGAITQAGLELNAVVEKAGSQIQDSISVLSREIHDQRQLTSQDLKDLIDYAAEKIGRTVDTRLLQARQEATQFIEERVAHLRQQLEDASVRSRRALYANLAISAGTALCMAAVALVYKKISLGELDVFALFRVLLLSAAVGTGMFSLVKSVQLWLGLNRATRNAATILLQQVSLLRPNGALGLFVLTLLLLAGWYFASFHL